MKSNEVNLNEMVTASIETLVIENDTEFNSRFILDLESIPSVSYEDALANLQGRLKKKAQRRLNKALAHLGPKASLEQISSIQAKITKRMAASTKILTIDFDLFK